MKMKSNQSFENCFNELQNRNDSFIDLTRPLDDSLEIYSSEGYSDPELEIKTWCSYMEKGFRVSRIMMGTQTGTHIDAPAHFIEGGAFVNNLQTSDLMGRYYYIDAATGRFDKDTVSGFRDEPFLFIRGGRGATELTEKFFMLLLDLSAKIWITAGEFTIKEKPGFYFNRKLAEKGKFLVEDIDMNAAETVTGNGYAFALPLKLMDTPGAPCRLIVLPDKQ